MGGDGCPGSYDPIVTYTESSYSVLVGSGLYLIRIPPLLLNDLLRPAFIPTLYYQG